MIYDFSGIATPHSKQPTFKVRNYFWMS